MAVSRFLDQASPDGESFGQTTSAKISFYGVAPLAQQSIAANGTDAATTQALANDLKAKLKLLGFFA